MKIFSKYKFLEAVRTSGNIGQVTPDMENELDNYDGCEAVKSGWKALVHDVEEYEVTGKDGRKASFPPQGIVEA